MASTAISDLLAKFHANQSGAASKLWQHAQPVLRDRIKYRLRKYPATDSEAAGIEHSAWRVFTERLQEGLKSEAPQNREQLVDQLKRLVDTPIKRLQREREKKHRYENIEWETREAPKTSTQAGFDPDSAEQLVAAIMSHLEREEERIAFALRMDGWSKDDIASKMNCSLRQIERYIVKAGHIAIEILYGEAE